jgi:hypothetical protein
MDGKYSPTASMQPPSRAELQEARDVAVQARVNAAAASASAILSKAFNSVSTVKALPYRGASNMLGGSANAEQFLRGASSQQIRSFETYQSTSSNNRSPTPADFSSSYPAAKLASANISNPALKSSVDDFMHRLDDIKSSIFKRMGLRTVEMDM